MAGQRIGYIRVSTLDQQTERQLEGLVLDQTFTDKASGKDTNRPQLEQMLRFARRGDTVVVHSMDRLARNLDDLRRIVHTLTGKGVRIAFVKEQLTFTGEDSPMASLLLSVMGAFAEFERALIHERQREGIALAKQRGAYHYLGIFGQVCSIFNDMYRYVATMQVPDFSARSGKTAQVVLTPIRAARAITACARGPPSSHDNKPELRIRGEGFPKDQGFDSIGLRGLSVKTQVREDPLNGRGYHSALLLS